MSPTLKQMRTAGEADTCQDLVQCMYSLTDLEMEALRELLRRGATTSDELAKRLRRDRSTVYRSLQKLVSCQVVRKETRSLERGGYYHAYTAVPMDVLRTRLEGCVEEWYGRLQGLLERFEQDMREADR
jgi:predicted transcriptional regulator